MGDVHLQRRQLDDLMSVIRCLGDQRAMATGTGGGLDQVDLRRAQQCGTVARMARTRPPWATGGPGLARGLVKRGIRRRRLAGGLRGALHASLQRLNLLLELVDTLLQALHMRLNGRRSQHPFRRRKGQSPEAHVGFGWRCWCQHPQGSAMRGRADVLIGNLTSEVNVIMTSHALKRPCGRVPYRLPRSWSRCWCSSVRFKIMSPCPGM